MYIVDMLSIYLIKNHLFYRFIVQKTHIAFPFQYCGKQSQLLCFQSIDRGPPQFHTEVKELLNK